MNVSDFDKWFDLFIRIIEQPLHVILIVIVCIQGYALFILGRNYIIQGHRRVRIRMILVTHIAKTYDIDIEDAEDRAARMIDRGSIS